MIEVSHVKLPSDECDWTLLMISQIAWANVDPYPSHHMESLGHNGSSQKHCDLFAD